VEKRRKSRITKEKKVQTLLFHTFGRKKKKSSVW